MSARWPRETSIYYQPGVHVHFAKNFNSFEVGDELSITNTLSSDRDVYHFEKAERSSRFPLIWAATAYEGTLNNIGKGTDPSSDEFNGETLANGNLNTNKGSIVIVFGGEKYTVGDKLAIVRAPPPTLDTTSL